MRRQPLVGASKALAKATRLVCWPAKRTARRLSSSSKSSDSNQARTKNSSLRRKSGSQRRSMRRKESSRRLSQRSSRCRHRSPPRRPASRGYWRSCARSSAVGPNKVKGPSRVAWTIVSPSAMVARRKTYPWPAPKARSTRHRLLPSTRN